MSRRRPSAITTPTPGERAARSIAQSREASSGGSMKRERESKSLALSAFLPALGMGEWESDAVSVRTVGKQARPIQRTAPMPVAVPVPVPVPMPVAECPSCIVTGCIACRARCASTSSGGNTAPSPRAGREPGGEPDRERGGEPGREWGGEADGEPGRIEWGGASLSALASSPSAPISTAPANHS